MKKFIILAEERSGSTYIRLWLNNHSAVKCHDELFKRVGPKDIDGFEHYMTLTHSRRFIHKVFGKQRFTRYKWFPLIHTFINNFLDEIYYNPAHPVPWTQLNERLKYKKISNSNTYEAIGFKLIYKHIFSYRYLEKFIKDNNFLVIHLIRENLLDKIISFQKAIHEKRFHTEDYQANSRKAFYIKPELVVDQIREAIYWREKVDHMFNSCKVLKITYEQFFFYQPLETKHKILSFLNLQQNDYMQAPALKKLNNSTPEELIINYNELKTSLIQNGYDDYLKKGSSIYH